MEKLLSDLEIGKEGIIKKINGEGRLRKRLFDMGVTPGARVLVLKLAPLGDPIEISIRNYLLTLRKSEAALVIVEEI